eukprot:TRINITY_DN2517_c0_g1_i11.p4 TRINITY_DN2517_c0_g1~~TRINITY_DN2517_c0_g1_i11.p4  ORF type:complete len:149 (+),score=20.73 TRINITY_DN2517_c0_g1_i11:34-480(+)
MTQVTVLVLGVLGMEAVLMLLFYIIQHCWVWQLTHRQQQQDQNSYEKTYLVEKRGLPSNMKIVIMPTESSLMIACRELSNDDVVDTNVGASNSQAPAIIPLYCAGDTSSDGDLNDSPCLTKSKEEEVTRSEVSDLEAGLIENQYYVSR